MSTGEPIAAEEPAQAPGEAEVAPPAHAAEPEADPAGLAPAPSPPAPPSPPSPSPSVTPGLDPGAEPGALELSLDTASAANSILGPSPRRTEGKAGAPAPVAEPRRRRSWVRALLIVLAVMVLWPPVSVLALRVIPPPVTILMLLRLADGHGLDKHWRPLDRISPSLATAVIAAEDSQFCEHHGFDFDAMRAAAEGNARSPNKVRGGSTISQQTAKNVFLWPSRDYLRKGLEAGYTVLIETLWGKRRILEAYLNVVEWGPGVYGAEAAAQHTFHVDASALSPAQSARLAAILPSPLKWNAAAPGRYVARRAGRIGANAQTVRADDLAWCVR